VLKLSLQEDGEHTLAVTVTYTETNLGVEGRAAGGRVRTFRKLYQFVARSLISVRTKACDVPGGGYALEAQLENLGDYGVVLEVCIFFTSFLLWGRGAYGIFRMCG
jgi:trafficking protein particle complex subunit 13